MLLSRAPLIRLLQEDHDVLRGLLSELGEGSRSQKKVVFEQLARLSLAHFKEEEIAVYIPLRGSARAEIQSLALKGLQEHALLEEIIYKVRLTPNGDLWEAKVGIFMDILGLHLQTEESEFFSLLKKSLSTEQMAEAAEKYSHLKEVEKCEIQSLRLSGGPSPEAGLDRLGVHPVKYP